MSCFPDIPAGRAAALERNLTFKESDDGSTIWISSKFGCSVLTATHSNPFLAESSNVYIHPDHRGKGLGLRFLRDRMAVWKALGLSAVFCSVNTENAVQRRLLVRAGWHRHFDINNTTQFWRVTL